MFSISGKAGVTHLCPSAAIAIQEEVSQSYMDHITALVSRALKNGPYRPSKEDVSSWKVIKDNIDTSTFPNTHFTLGETKVPLLSQAILDDLSQSVVNDHIAKVAAQISGASPLKQAEWSFTKGELQDHTFRKEGYLERIYRISIGQKKALH